MEVINYRQASVEDGSFVYDITKATMKNYVEATFGPWVEKDQKAMSADSFDPKTHEIIEIDGEPAGLLATSIHEDHIQIEKLYIRPELQRKGIGSKVLDRIKRMSRENAKPIRLRVLESNKGACRLYERHNFVIYKSTSERVFMEYCA